MSGCVEASRCFIDQDCLSNLCRGQTCQGSTCDDNVQNGDESAVDCGGQTCPGCSVGRSAPSTRLPIGVCVDGQCRGSECGNGRLDEDETDVDCGGFLPGLPRFLADAKRRRTAKVENAKMADVRPSDAATKRVPAMKCAMTVTRITRTAA